MTENSVGDDILSSRVGANANSVGADANSVGANANSVGADIIRQYCRGGYYPPAGVNYGF